MFDPGGSEGRLRARSFLRTWRALLCGEAMRVRAAGGDLQCFFCLEGGLRNILSWSEVQATRPPFLCSQAVLKGACRRGRLEAIESQGRTVAGERHGAMLDGKEPRGARGGEPDHEPRGSPFSGRRLHCQPILLHRLQCGMLIL